MPRLTTEERETAAREGIAVWHESTEAGKAWLVAQYHAEAARSTAMMPLWSAYQKVFVTKNSSVKATMERLDPSLASNIEFAKASLKTISEADYEEAIAQKDQRSNAVSEQGKATITSAIDLTNRFHEIGEQMTSTVEQYEETGKRVTADILCPIGVCLVFALSRRIDEIDPRAKPREDGHVAELSDYIFNGNTWSLTHHNGSKGRGAQVRPPRGIVSLLEPQLVQRMLRAWFAHVESIKPDTKSFSLTWHYGGRFEAELKRFGFDQIVKPIGDHKLHLYDVKGWALKILDLIHDVTECRDDIHDAVINARRAQAGHFRGSTASESYTAMRVEDSTGFEPRRKKLKLSNLDLYVVDYESGCEDYESGCEDDESGCEY